MTSDEDRQAAADERKRQELITANMQKEIEQQANIKIKLYIKELEQENDKYKNKVDDQYSKKLRQANKNTQILGNFISKNYNMSLKAILENYRLSKRQNDLNKAVHYNSIPCITPDSEENNLSL